MRNLILAGAALAALLAAGGCARSFETDPHIATLNAEHLGAAINDVRAANAAQTDLLEKYYADDAARRWLARDGRRDWILRQYENAGAKMAPAEVRRFAEDYLRDTDDVRAILSEQYGNIKALEALGESNATNLRAYSRAQSQRLAAERRSSQYETDALQAFVAETAAAISAAKVAREMEEQRREAVPPDLPHEESPIPAKPAETPAKPAETPAKPAETPAKPAETPAKPAETPAKPDLSALLGRF